MMHRAKGKPLPKLTTRTAYLGISLINKHKLLQQINLTKTTTPAAKRRERKGEWGDWRRKTKEVKLRKRSNSWTVKARFPQFSCRPQFPGDQMEEGQYLVCSKLRSELILEKISNN